MFSGIIQTLAKAQKIEKGKNTLKIYFQHQEKYLPKLGESIAIDGICSTIESSTKNNFSVFYMPETLRKTNLAHITSAHTYNIEMPLTLNTLISGHLVTGHIDTTAKLLTINKKGNSYLMTFKLPSKFTKYIVYKGSIALNGVSLTIVSSAKNLFSVSLIPFTLRNTNLGNLKIGDLVNVEVDMIAKYLEKLK